MDQKPATPSIEAAQGATLASLPFADDQDFADADRGFLAALEPGVVTAADGRVVWDNDSYSFLDGEAPPTVNPSLWRQSQLVARQGLFEVVDGIYQVRGLDLSNITFVEGDTGVIVIDPLISTETAAAALGLYRMHRGDRTVVAVIYSHSHVDHFGGVFGVATQEEVDSGTIAVIAPEGFVGHAVEENVYAGTAMSRRAGYMYGAVLDRGPQGQVGAGLGQTTSAGEVGLIVPTLEVTTTGETHTIDGVEIEFQMAPGTEAPAEMHFYFPRYRALCMAENATHTLHNLLTLRGALVRDPHVVAVPHRGHRDVRVEDGRRVLLPSLAHLGSWPDRRVPLDAARPVRVLARPDAAPVEPGVHGHRDRGDARAAAGAAGFLEHARLLRVRQPQRQGDLPALHGMVRRQSRPALGAHAVEPRLTVCQRDRWHRPRRDRPDGLRRRRLPLGRHPARPCRVRRRVARRGSGALRRHARATRIRRRERHVAQLLPLRRDGARGANFGTPAATSAPAIVAQLTPEQLFDAIAISVNGPKAWDLTITLDVTFTDLGANYRATLHNGVFITVEKAADAASADATITTTKPRMIAFIGGDTTSPGLEITGNAGVLQELLSVLDAGDPSFNIVTP